MKIIHWLPLGVLALSLAVSSQSEKPGHAGEGPSPSKLKLAEVVEIKGQQGAAMQLPMRCDGDGNLYVRFYGGRGALKEPIYKFDKDGHAKAVFKITSDPAFDGKAKGGLDFAVDKDGNVYQLGVSGDGKYSAYIVGYDKQGGIKSKTKLEPDFDALQFDVFDSGKFLVTGLERETASNLNPHAAYTGVFDENGRLVKKVTLTEDKKYEEAAERGDAEFIDKGRLGGGNFAIERGGITRASDGNIYILRWTNPARVYAISPAGEVVHSFEVKVAQPTKKPSGIHEYGGKLAIQFEGDRQDPSPLIKIVSLLGEEYSTYDSNGFGVAFVCYYDRERFAFFAADSKSLTVKFAEPE